MQPSIFISAGEASGEHYGALLAAALTRRMTAAGQTATMFGMGGDRMAAAGVERIVHSEDMAVMGFTEIVHHLPRIYREFRKLKKAIGERRPDVAVLIDFPEIHFRLARELHRLGIPVIFFVSPQLWAWKKHRIKLVQRYIRKMLVIFPFEESFYRENGVEAEFVGHPLAELPLPAICREQFAAENSLDPTRTWIGLLPGSRSREIQDHLAEMLEAARQLQGATSPSEPYEFVVPLASTLSLAQRGGVLQIVKEHGAGLSVHLVDDARAVLLHARASVVASGTATVEAALIGNPFVVIYHVSALTFAIAKHVVKVPHVAMANLIAGKRVVPELIQEDFTATNIVQHLSPLLPDGPARQSMMEDLAAIRAALNLRPEAASAKKITGAAGAIERVAAITLKELEASSPAAIELIVQS
jgi:lipid-A-disaccharide synthase